MKAISVRSQLLFFFILFAVLAVIFLVLRWDRLAVAAALAGMAVAGAISFGAVTAIANVADQLRHMPAAALRPIQIGESAFFPRELAKLVATFNNLLDRTAKAQLAELEAISQVGDSLLITTPGGMITYINEAGAKALGEVLSLNLKDLVDPDAASAIFQNGGAGEWKGDVTVKRSDTSTFDGFLSSTRIMDSGQTTSIVVIIQDITKEKAERDSLTHSERMITLGELVAGTSHELNNPLAIVTGYSDLLLEDETLSAEQRSKIDAIRKNALRASGVVHSLLAFARKRKPERQSTDVNKVVNAAAGLKEYDLFTSGVRFERELAPTLPPVLADPNQLQQVLLNVINNAQDAVLQRGEDPTISLRTELKDDSVVITIKDNGTGISRDNLKKVFDPFFTTKPVGKATGLGLSISYGIIREHNGHIRIRSEEGQGTEVSVELPTAPHADLSPPVSGAGRPRLSVLIVDDEPEIVTIIREGLGAYGFGVDSAAGMAEALDLAKRRNYDFILTDVKMPGGSGIELYKQLCALQPAYKTRTIFLTGDTSNPATLDFLESEGLAYFSKPFDFKAMERHLFEKAESLLR